MAGVLAARFYEQKKPLRLEQVELPAISEDDVLIDIKASGICHSDVHLVNGLFPPARVPITPGHEISGVVMEKGKNVTELEIGDRIGVDYVFNCGTCYYCRNGMDNLCDNCKYLLLNLDGGWAEKIAVPKRQVHKLPSNLGFPEGAIMNCAVMTAYHAMKLARVSVAERVGVYGIGGIGMQIVRLAKVFGASEIVAVGRNEEKLKLAREFGATTTVNTSEGDPVKMVRDATGGGVDAAFEAIGTVDTVKRTIGFVRKGGRAVIIGLIFDNVPISPGVDLMAPEIKLLGSSDHVKSETPEVVSLIENGRLDLSRSVSHKFPLTQVNEGIRIVDEEIGNPIRVVLEP